MSQDTKKGTHNENTPINNSGRTSVIIFTGLRISGEWISHGYIHR